MQEGGIREAVRRVIGRRQGGFAGPHPADVLLFRSPLDRCELPSPTDSAQNATSTTPRRCANQRMQGGPHPGPQRRT